ncbi:Transposase family tnp2 [Rhizoctonia solani]|uniref:Transposase family tnp2 n=1 Tax=Rhizoctonia solani TaxID=456999 RepID=A0A8H8NRB5_9AGAM|nr:Transposase family tnp2 [Rhizoctonia solani]QRW17362.1 Transposase family tnp2 [Rhizoctonia solani]
MPVPSLLHQQQSLRSLSPPWPGLLLHAPPEQFILGPDGNDSPEPPELRVRNFNQVPDCEDVALLWAQVLKTRVRVEEDSTSGPTEISVASGFVSRSDSDASAEPTEPLEGCFNAATYGLSPSELLREERRVQMVLNGSQAQSLSQHPNALFHRSWMILNRFCLTRSHASLPSLKNLCSRILALCGLKPVTYDCCKNSCICFAGPFANLQSCPECNTPRKNAAGAPQKTFTYIPLIPQLQALYCSLRMCEAMQYRHNYKRNKDTIEDYFDGNQYCELLGTYVTVDGEQKPFKFFADWREIALALSTDGMCPFKRRKNSCWPLILINLNLPPNQRTHLENLVCVGVIPGPKSPKNLGSFLWPLIDELLQLASGVSAVDVSTKQLFSLRAHLLAVFGNIPAITKLLDFVGHNGRFPCRFCLMSAIQGATAGGGTHLYCPLHRKEEPFFDPMKLPARTHQECIEQGLTVLQAQTSNAQSKLATATGVKGVSSLARLPSISIPASFPIDIMHMIFINIIPQLIDIWTGNFNNMDEGKGTYHINPILFKRIGEIVANSGSTIPTSYGCRVPDISAPSHGSATAEAWSIFGGYLGPYVLRKRFRNPKYYQHFVRLIKLVNQITSYEIKRSDIPEIRKGFIRWVKEYENYNPLTDERTILLGRCASNLKISDQLQRKICGYLVQSFGISVFEAKKAIPERVPEWRRLRISQGGDTITARGSQKIRSDARDSSFVRYELLVDKNARHRNAPVDLQPVSQYGQLQHIFQLDLKARSAANPSSKSIPLILALIHKAPVLIENTHEYKVVSYPDGQLKSGKVVDAQTIHADCEFTFPSFT